jgi:acyl carrier protein
MWRTQKQEDLIPELKQCLSENSDIDAAMLEQLGPRDSLVEKGILDSLSTMKFVIALEKRFDVQINFNKINGKNFSTLEKIEKFIHKAR